MATTFPQIDAIWRLAGLRQRRAFLRRTIVDGCRESLAAAVAVAVAGLIDGFLRAARGLAETAWPVLSLSVALLLLLPAATSAIPVSCGWCGSSLRAANGRRERT